MAMNDPVAGSGARRVRPAVRRLAVAAVVVLLPAAIHSLWDYVEIRRLVREIEAVRAKGEPVTAKDAAGGRVWSMLTDRGAGRFYMAGGMLVGEHVRATAPVYEWLATARPDRALLPALGEPLRAVVAENGEALAMADRAAALPFNGFPPGTEFSYRIGSISTLAGIVSARTLSLAIAGDGDRAVDSALSGLQMVRPLRDSPWMWRPLDQVAPILSLSRPSPDALQRLQAALDAQEAPDAGVEALVRQRALHIDAMWLRYYGADASAPRHYSLPMRSVGETIVRPWMTHQMVAALRLWAELIDVARLPWPERTQRGSIVLEAESRADERQGAAFLGRSMSRGLALGNFRQAVDPTPLILTRAARVAVAVERYRHDHRALPSSSNDLVPRYLKGVPLDPYTGRPLALAISEAVYTIYSVGPNRQDDRGDLTSELDATNKRGWGRRLVRGMDVGIRVLVQ